MKAFSFIRSHEAPEALSILDDTFGSDTQELHRHACKVQPAVADIQVALLPGIGYSGFIASSIRGQSEIQTDSDPQFHVGFWDGSVGGSPFLESRKTHGISLGDSVNLTLAHELGHGIDFMKRLEKFGGDVLHAYLDFERDRLLEVRSLPLSDENIEETRRRYTSPAFQQDCIASGYTGDLWELALLEHRMAYRNLPTEVTADRYGRKILERCE